MSLLLGPAEAQVSRRPVGCSVGDPHGPQKDRLDLPVWDKTYSSSGLNRRDHVESLGFHKTLSFLFLFASNRKSDNDECVNELLIDT